MDVPPTYQEAISSAKRKENWLKRIFVKIFKFNRSPPQPGLLVERKLITPFRQTANTSSSSKSTKSKAYRNSTALPTSLNRNSIHQSTISSPSTNYVRIKRSNAPIIGIWTIDTSLVVPEELLVPFKNKNEKRHHLHLWSQTQKIDAGANIVGNGDGTVLLTVSSEGPVNFAVSKPSHRKLSIFCRGSTIFIRIPRSYRGTLKAHSSTGSVHFSSEVSKVVRSIYEKGSESRWFIGRMDSRPNSLVVAGAGKDGVEGVGKGYDVMKLKAKSRVGDNYGEIFVGYEDEEEPFVSDDDANRKVADLNDLFKSSFFT